MLNSIEFVGVWYGGDSSGELRLGGRDRDNRVGADGPYAQCSYAHTWDAMSDQSIEAAPSFFKNSSVNL